MNSHPISVRNKNSKFTLTKKEFYNNINKIGNNINANKIINEINNFQNEYAQYKKSVLKKNPQNNQMKSSNRFSGKLNNHTTDKSKKDLNTFNTEFLKLFREINLLKKNKNSNKTAIETSLQEKTKLKSIYNKSISNSKSKGKSSTKNNKNNNFKKPKYQNSKSKNLKINTDSTYEPIYTNEKNDTLNNTQRNVILTSNNKNKNVNINNQPKNKLPKKTFKTFNPFTIKFAKPINSQLKNNKQSNITTYNINFSKLIPNRINSLQNNFNKTQEIIHNISKTKQKQEMKKQKKENYNSNNNIIKNINNVSNKNKNNLSKSKKNEIKNNSEIEEEENVIKQKKNSKTKNEINNLMTEQNISDIDIFDDKENFYNNNDDDEESEDNSGVLAYDEVRDIIVYYDMGDLVKKQGYLFQKDDYKHYLNSKKENYLNFFINPYPNEKNKNKKNFINVTKN